jgi:hypothetical protein
MWLWRSSRLPQGGKSSFPLPRGLGRCCCCRRHGCRCTPSHLRGARRCLRSARRLSRRLPGGGRSRARPRRCLFRRLRGSGRGGRRLPPLGGSPSPIALLLVRRRVLRSRRGGESQLLAQLELLTSLFPALPSPDPLLLLARRPLLLPLLRRACARSGSGRGRVGPRGVHGHHLQGASETPDYDDATRINGSKRSSEPYSPAGPRGAW